MSDFDKALFRLIYIMVIGLLLFGVVVAIGKVQADTSFGLTEILHTVELLAAGLIGLLAGRGMPKEDPPSGSTK